MSTDRFSDDLVIRKPGTAPQFASVLIADLQVRGASHEVVTSALRSWLSENVASPRLIASIARSKYAEALDVLHLTA